MCPQMASSSTAVLSRWATAKMRKKSWLILSLSSKSTLSFTDAKTLSKCSLCKISSKMTRNLGLSLSMVMVSCMPRYREALKKYCRDCWCSYPKNTDAVVSQQCVLPVLEKKNAVITCASVVSSPPNISSLTTYQTSRASFSLALPN